MASCSYWVKRSLPYLSILMATRFKMLAVLSVTSNAIQKSQIVSLSSQSTLTFNFPTDPVIHPAESGRARERKRRSEVKDERL